MKFVARFVFGAEFVRAVGAAVVDDNSLETMWREVLAIKSAEAV
jgi:hypothetical protein